MRVSGGRSLRTEVLICRTGCQVSNEVRGAPGDDHRTLDPDPPGLPPTLLGTPRPIDVARDESRNCR